MKRTLLRLMATACGIAFPVMAFAAYNIDVGLIDPCISSDLACNSNLANLFSNTILKTALTAFKGFLLGSLLYYGLRMLVTADSDNAVTETKQAYEYAVVAALLVMGAEVIAGSFTVPGGITPQRVGGLLESKIIPFLVGLVSAALIANITVQGFMMIIASDEGGATKARKRFLHGIIGAAIVMLASPFIKAIWGGDGGSLGNEAQGIGNFLITIFGALAVVGVIVSGFMLVLSVDESLKEKARKLLISCIVALIVVICSAGLLNMFLISPS